MKKRNIVDYGVLYLKMMLKSMSRIKYEESDSALGFPLPYCGRNYCT